MRLDFNVLWVEDQPKAVQAQKESIERRVRAEGFRLQAQFAQSVEEAKSFLADEIYNDHIDMILMDYDFGVGTKGDVGLREVRERLPYREIIFYSAQATDLYEIVTNQKIEGVYCSNREELPDRAHNVFEMLIKKVLDIDHSRGIVMGVTSDIDNYVNSSLVSAFNMSDEPHQSPHFR